MCTATFIKDDSNRIIFTTNRDESASRPTTPPEIHQVGDLKLLFPQDQLAGGTWVAVGQSGLICCVLNGAKGEENWLGTRAEKSRGQVLLDAFRYDSAEAFFAEGDFEKAHPFTLLRIHPDNNIITAIKWNGTKKWVEQFDSQSPQIWSAFTLYPFKQRNQRAKMFREWVQNKQHLSAKEILKMHQASKINNGLLLENSSTVNTVSTTQLILDTEKCIMSYFEIGNDRTIQSELKRIN